MQHIRAEALENDLSSDIQKKNICRQHGFRDISEKPEVIDASYPWYGGAVVYNNKKHPGLYFPVLRATTSHGG